MTARFACPGEVSGLDSWKQKVDRRTAARLAGEGHVASNVPHEVADLACTRFVDMHLSESGLLFELHRA